MQLHSIRRVAAGLVHSRSWHPTHTHLLSRHLYYYHRNRDSGWTDHHHLLQAAQWLERAQDITGDNGVSGRYLLKKGWTSSYPETTGYIIPTFLALAQHLESEHWRHRAQRAVEFLLSVQLPDGSFPGLEIAANITKPSVFNTAQIIHGLVAWHASGGDDRAIQAACRAGDWLVSMQDDDGAWRQHTYKDLPVTYSAHASCWLADLGRHTDRSDYLVSVKKHLNWVLSHCDADTGWIDHMGFIPEDHEKRRAVTHTIAYTLWGILMTSELLGLSNGIDAVEKAATRIARRFELSGRLPGVLNYRWQPQSTYTCLTGNAQVALIWLRLFALRGDTRLLNTAVKALDDVKAAQPMTNSNDGIQGGIPGSYPLWGGYVYMGIPNWAAKFFIDALLAKQEALRNLTEGKVRTNPLPNDLPNSLPSYNSSTSPPLKIVMYARPGTKKVQQMVKAWSPWQFKPSMVVIEHQPEPPWWARLIQKIQEDGLTWIGARLFNRKIRPIDSTSANGEPEPTASLVEFCNKHDIPMLNVDNFNSHGTLDAIKALQPDLTIQAGTGILRAPLLAIGRLGTLNAHMGILPNYRGMNVAEWAALESGPVGCSVHLIDRGIDTGDILCIRYVPVDSATTIRALRRQVDRAQLDLLGDVVRYVIATGELPPLRAQKGAEGQQYFRMSSELTAILEAKLKDKRTSLQ